MTAAPVASFAGVSLRFGKTRALDEVTLEIPAGQVVGLVGPDGAGKSSLLSLISGERAVQQGTVHVLDGDMARESHRTLVCPRIAYMPQGLGKNLYPSLSVEENLQFFGRLFGHGSAERRRRIDDLTRSTGLFPFLSRPVGKLSGGMKQKLGVCCALIHDPELLILDEPTTGVDPLARAQFWSLVERVRRGSPGMSVVVATAYMDEAARFDWIIAMDAGRVLTAGTPRDVLTRTGTRSLDAAFIALLPEEKRREYRAVTIPPLDPSVEGSDLAIEATNLTKRFGGFVAVDRVTFRIRRGEIFGFIGSNGCGKSTTMKMLTGLLAPTEGRALLFGRAVSPDDLATRRRVGYMSQAFSLYTELSVEQNLLLHARLFQLPKAKVAARVDEMVCRFGLGDVRRAMPRDLPPGIRQRLSLAVAMVHQPELLILDEPTSGVDPIARDQLWQLMIDLARKDKVTIFISTHFMNEAERCDRISLMNDGRVLVTDTAARIIAARGAATLEDAFVDFLADAHGGATPGTAASAPPPRCRVVPAPPARARLFRPGRAFGCCIRETLELARDPTRAALALLGTIILMFVIGFGVNMDVENLTYGVLDHDQSALSQSYTQNIEGSQYFVAHAPITDYADLDRRMKSGELALVLEIPPGFARDVERGKSVAIGAWIDGAMPQRGETAQGYVQGMHQAWLLDAPARGAARVATPATATIATRFRYNPDVESLPAMVPAVIPMLLMMIPAMLAALSVVREKELGSITNLYVTPLTRTEFLVGKQLPYVFLALVNFGLMALLSVNVLGVPMKGSFLALAVAAVPFVMFSTGLGLLASTFMRSQVAAMFVTMIATMIPAAQFSGLIDPVSSMAGASAVIARGNPTTYFMLISRGVFSKALGFSSLHASFWPLFLAVPVVLCLAVALLKKQET